MEANSEGARRLAIAWFVPLATVIALSVSTGCTSTNSTLEPAADPALDALVEAFMEERGVVGLALGITLDDQIVYLRGYGLADRENNVPVDPRRTRFRWASVSKTLTGVAAMSLAEAGHLDLNAVVSDVFPGYSMPSSYATPLGSTLPLPEETEITVRQLLNHTSGIQHYRNGVNGVFPTPEPSDRNNPSINTGFLWAFPLWASEPLLFEPGAGYGYTSSGYNLLGAVIGSAQNAVTGGNDTIEEGYLRRVNGLLGDTFAAGVRPDYQWQELSNRAKGYKVDEDLNITADGDSDVSWKLPGGGFISTTEEATHYCRLLMTDQFLSSPTRAEAYNALGPLGTPRYHHGFQLDSRNGQARVSHSGSQQKVRSRLSFYPGEKLGLVAFSNTYSLEIDESLLEDLFDEEAPEIRIKDLTDPIEDLLLGRLGAGEAAIQP